MHPLLSQSKSAECDSPREVFRQAGESRLCIWSDPSQGPRTPPRLELLERNCFAHQLPELKFAAHLREAALKLRGWS
jgi:hypothetical protein